MEGIVNFFNQVSSFVWGPVAIFLLIGTGIYLSIKLKLVQLRKLKYGVQILFGLYDHEETEEGEINHFEALTSALSATIGTGNIAGVGTAIALGGPGALFWMWVTAFFGMATKYASCLLGSKYRVIDVNGDVTEEPIYYLECALEQK